jgi:hypothetical protein
MEAIKNDTSQFHQQTLSTVGNISVNSDCFATSHFSLESIFSQDGHSREPNQDLEQDEQRKHFPSSVHEPNSAFDYASQQQRADCDIKDACILGLRKR